MYLAFQGDRVTIVDPVAPSPRAALAGALQGACIQRHGYRRRRIITRHARRGSQTVDQDLEDLGRDPMPGLLAQAAQGGRSCGIRRQGAVARSITQSMALKT
jgi:hypothetical protein